MPSFVFSCNVLVVVGVGVEPRVAIQIHGCCGAVVLRVRTDRTEGPKSRWARRNACECELVERMGLFFISQRLPFEIMGSSVFTMGRTCQTVRLQQSPGTFQTGHFRFGTLTLDGPSTSNVTSAGGTDQADQTRQPRAGLTREPMGGASARLPDLDAYQHNQPLQMPLFRLFAATTTRLLITCLYYEILLL
jgi:hypothetical protein